VPGAAVGARPELDRPPAPTTITHTPRPTLRHEPDSRKVIKLCDPAGPISGSLASDAARTVRNGSFWPRLMAQPAQRPCSEHWPTTRPAGQHQWKSTLAVLTFCGTVADLVADRRGVARRHDSAVRLLADLKSAYRLTTPGESPLDRQARLTARYQAVMAELPPIPEHRFNPLKAKHLRKIEISKILSANPGMSEWQGPRRFASAPSVIGVPPCWTDRHAQGCPVTMTSAMPTHDLVSSYVLAKQEVLRAGYVDEVAWQGRARLADVDPVGFLREAAWVVLSAGMAERVVRTKFPALAQALHQWCRLSRYMAHFRQIICPSASGR